MRRLTLGCILCPSWAVLVPVLQALACDQELKLKLHQRDHDLTGNWSGYRECHLKSDLMLLNQRFPKRIFPNDCANIFVGLG